MNNTVTGASVNTGRFHLIMEKPGQAARPSASIWQRRRAAVPGRLAPADKLEVPDGVSYLVIRAGKPPQLRTELSNPSAGAFALEHVQEGKAARLLMLGLNDLRARVNGEDAPPVTLLREGDEIAFGGGCEYVAHITIFDDPYVGPPPPGALGKPCPICKVKFTPDTTTWVCRCGLAMHLEGEAKPADDRLDCAGRCATCPRCGRPVVMQKGYSYLPEL